MVRRVCDRDRGVGADGVVVLHTYLGSTPHLKTEIINSDGTPVEMCGNALRCIAKVSQAENLGQLFLMGQREIRAEYQDDGQATVCIGVPDQVGDHPMFASLPELDKLLGHRGHLLSFGNPHYVVPVTSIPENWADLGSQSQIMADRILGTGGINLGWLQAKPQAKEVPRLCVYERGVGVTASCGSGACAASATRRFLGQGGDPDHLRLPGGTLSISVRDGKYYLTGEAVCESTGTWEEAEH